MCLNGGEMRIEGVEITAAGQAGELGTYPHLFSLNSLIYPLISSLNGPHFRAIPHSLSLGGKSVHELHEAKCDLQHFPALRHHSWH